MTQYNLNEFVPIKGFEKYLINKDGVILSTYLNSYKERKYKVDKDGYLHLGLFDSESNKKFRRVHRMVAITFIPNPNNYPIVNHKDGNVKNNNVDNLEWCTDSYNKQHSFRVLGRKPPITNNRVVKYRDKSNGKINTANSILDFANDIGYSYEHTLKVLNDEVKWKNSSIRKKYEIISVGCND